MTHKNLPVRLYPFGAPTTTRHTAFAETVSIEESKTLSTVRPALPQDIYAPANHDPRLRATAPNTHKIKINGLFNADLFFNYIQDLTPTRWELDIGGSNCFRAYLLGSSMSINPNQQVRMSLDFACLDWIGDIPVEGGEDYTVFSDPVNGYDFSLAGDLLNNTAELTYAISFDWDFIYKMGNQEPTVFLAGIKQRMDVTATGFNTGDFGGYDGLCGAFTLTHGSDSLSFSTNARIASQSYDLNDLVVNRASIEEVLV